MWIQTIYWSFYPLLQLTVALKVRVKSSQVLLLN